MSDSTTRNRLSEEASPYLRQHADNPVHWQPWDDTALEAARERDVPIFLSIGYSACHWCHVMEDESFEDDAVAEVLNDSFVPVKVDREERPDLDRVYQTVCQLVSGRGGWPLSVWLTPEGKPFYVGTYFPRDGRQGMPGFLEICSNMADSWADPDQREDIENRAEQWTDAIRDELEEPAESTDVDVADANAGNGAASTADESILDDATTTAIRSADPEHGGFGHGGPKFPQPERVDLLMRAYARSGRAEPLDTAIDALEAMGNGGLFDHVGGGFHRYCTDQEWVVPHFEKMLYDNAELSRVYLNALQLTGRSRYGVIAQETLGFVDRELSHPDGGFYATLDADSGEGEGAYYVWTPDGILEAVEDELTTDLLCDRFGVTREGNFEGGTTVLTISAGVEELGDEYDLETTDVQRRLIEGRMDLLDAREKRERPPRDEKVLAGWNGLMISAFAAGGVALGEGLADRAVTALGFVREHLWDGERLSRRFIAESEQQSDGDDTTEASRHGDVKGKGYLEDYAFLARGAFDVYQVTGEVAHLSFALELARVVREAFYDADAGTIYATPADGEELVARPQEPKDQSTPSSLGVATSLLLDLHQFAPDDGFEDVATDVLATYESRIRASPLEHTTLAMAAAKRARGPLELTLAADELPDEWRETLEDHYLPGAIIAPRPATESNLAEWLDELGLADAPPVWANRNATDGEPTAYVCENFTCSPPNHDLEGALAWANEGGD